MCLCLLSNCLQCRVAEYSSTYCLLTMLRARPTSFCYVYSLKWHSLTLYPLLRGKSSRAFRLYVTAHVGISNSASWATSLKGLTFVQVAHSNTQQDPYSNTYLDYWYATSYFMTTPSVRNIELRSPPIA